MNTLRIQQGSNVEIVSAQIINKLYDIALTVSEPLEGELDNAYLSGNLLVGRASRTKCTYLTNRFEDLHINVTDSYYIDFEDPAVELLLITKGVSSDGVGVTESDAANTTLSGVFSSNYVGNTDVTKFNEFTKFTLVKTNIPNNLFRGCYNLEEVNLSDTVTIGQGSFRGSGIKDINIPILQSLGNDAFYESGVETITNLGTILEIPDSAFRKCINLTSAVLPTTLTSIGDNAFGMYNTSGTKVFTTISGLENVTSFGSYCFSDNYLLQIQASDLSKAQTIGSYAFRSVTLVGDIYMKDLTSLGSNVFHDVRSITKVLCLGKINTIPEYTFIKGNTTNSANLTEVYLPYECTSIGKNAFRRNTGLTTLKQYEHSVDNWVEGLTPTYNNVSRVTSIGGGAFEGCRSLSGGIDFTNVTSIEDIAFEGCTSFTTEINAPNLTTLGKGAFYNSGITRVTNLGSITSLRSYPGTGYTHGCFEDCTNLTELVIPNTVTTIESSSFCRCTSLSTFTIDYSVITTLGGAAFLNVGCNLGVVNFENLSTIGVKAFCGNTMEAIYFPILTTTYKGGYYWNYVYNNGLFVHGNESSRTTINGIVYFRDILKFYPGDFADVNIHKIVINNSTPPELCNTNDEVGDNVLDKNSKTRIFYNTNLNGTSDFGLIGGIYVPDAALSTYLNDTDWGQYSSYIHPISDLSTVATKAAWDLLSASAKPDTLIEEYM